MPDWFATYAPSTDQFATWHFGQAVRVRSAQHPRLPGLRGQMFILVQCQGHAARGRRRQDQSGWRRCRQGLIAVTSQVDRVDWDGALRVFHLLVRAEGRVQMFGTLLREHYTSRGAAGRSALDSPDGHLRG